MKSKKIFTMIILIFILSLDMVYAKTTTEIAFCDYIGVVRTFKILGILLFIIKVIVPLIIIVMTLIDVFKIVLSGKGDSNIIGLIGKILVAGFIIFLVPGTLSYVFNKMVNNDIVTYNSCTVCLLDTKGCEVPVKDPVTFIKEDNKNQQYSKPYSNKKDTIKKDKDEDDSKFKRILIIGNSKVYYNNMPTMLENFMNEAHQEGKIKYQVNVEQFSFSSAAGSKYATNGKGLKEILSNSNCVSKIKEKAWDYIIVTPGSGEVFKSSKTAELIDKIYDYASLKNKDVNIIIEIPQLGTSYGKGNVSKTENAMEDAIKLSKVSDDNVKIAYGYQAYYEYYKDNDGWDSLYQKDNRHATVEGSYLITSVLYSTITGNSPVGINYKGDVKPSEVTNSKNDYSGEDGTVHCAYKTHKGVSNYKDLQELAWKVERNKDKF